MSLRAPLILLAIAAVGVAVWWQYVYLSSELSQINIESVYLDPPPKREGIYAQNDILAHAEVLHENKLFAPESIIVEDGGRTIYATVHNGIALVVDGKLVKKIPYNTSETCVDNHLCSRPLGIRRLDENTLIVADPVKGIVTLNLQTETYDQLIPAGTVLHGRPVRFADDLAVIDRKRIVFTDASWAFGFAECDTALFSGATTGRVYLYDIASSESTLLFDGLLFANGIELLPDGESFVVTETIAARVYRYYFAGPRKGLSEIFIDNLPGQPDNIRLSHDGKSLYVALAFPRTPKDGWETLLTMDWILRHPWLRWIITNIVPTKVIQFVSAQVRKERHGGALQLDLNGKVIRSLFAPDSRIDHISQIQDDGKYLYICSYANPYLARIPATAGL